MLFPDSPVPFEDIQRIEFLVTDVQHLGILRQQGNRAQAQSGCQTGLDHGAARLIDTDFRSDDFFHVFPMKL